MNGMHYIGRTLMYVLPLRENMTSYYDLVLGLIPLTLGGIAALLTVVGVALTTAVALASVVAVGLVGHAMFVKGPVDDATTTTDGGGLQPAD